MSEERGVPGGEPEPEVVDDDLPEDDFPEDEPLPEDDGEPEPQGDGAQPEVPPRRRESQFQRYKRELDETRRELAELKQYRPAQPPPTGPDPQQIARQEAEFQQYLETLTPAQAVIAVRDRMAAAYQHDAALRELRAIEREDQREFRRNAQNDRARTELMQEVERTVAGWRQIGILSLTREDAFLMLRGRQLEQQRARKGPQQRREGAARVAAQTTRPAGARGDVAAGRRATGDNPEAVDARLRGQTF